MGFVVKDKEKVIEKFRKICWEEYVKVSERSKVIIGWDKETEEIAIATHGYIVAICELNLHWEEAVGLDEEEILKRLAYGFDVLFDAVISLGQDGGDGEALLAIEAVLDDSDLSWGGKVDKIGEIIDEVL